MAAILIVPGYQNSGPGHWQSLWEGSLRDAKRVEMPNWDFPHKVDWVEALDEAIAGCTEPPILVGHSLGCLAIVHWAKDHDREIRGALLAAPSDVERPDVLPVLRSFAPIPRQRLPFQSILAASSDDPFLTPARAHILASDWGARLVDLGPCGHLNLASGHGPWPRGEGLLADIL
ncbi:RBBP9/YdeN family alpha/beta hydrolase [Geothrix alkalitolerans]|uniref:RBBP9/YdeN family alpha/beta hydrolase n=1 Tax=Geothrix alkalitolerans TaxID=2922724 RepID=UPI001FAF678F|nr:alpha/beta fold hydrolase [Geothrix alkalitolerans]